MGAAENMGEEIRGEHVALTKARREPGQSDRALPLGAWAHLALALVERAGHGRGRAPVTARRRSREGAGHRGANLVRTDGADHHERHVVRHVVPGSRNREGSPGWKLAACPGRRVPDSRRPLRERSAHTVGGPDSCAGLSSPSRISSNTTSRSRASSRSSNAELKTMSDRISMPFSVWEAGRRM